MTTRETIAKAIRKTFEDAYQEHREDYNPDTCWAAADEVAAALAAQLLDREVIATFPPLIGAAEFSLGESVVQ